MKSKFLVFAIMIFAFGAMSFLNPGDPIKIGETSPAFAELTTNIDGNDAILRTYVKGNGIMVIFSCNTCPFVKLWEDRYDGLANYCKANNIGFVLINSNAAKRNDDDSFQAMQNHAKEMNYTYPYVIDHNSTIANMLGAKTTPHVFLFNNNFELVYRGAIDDNHKDASKVTNTYALNAMRNFIAGITPSPETTVATGCSIKRVK